MNRNGCGTNSTSAGTGPIANFVYALVLIAIAAGIKGIETGQAGRAGIGLLVSGGVACPLWFGRRYIALVLPILTIPILALIGYAIFSISPTKAVADGSGGPVAVIASLAGAKSVTDAFLLAAILSFNLGIINLIPLPPLDGGRIFKQSSKLGLAKDSRTPTTGLQFRSSSLWSRIRSASMRFAFSDGSGKSRRTAQPPLKRWLIFIVGSYGFPVSHRTKLNGLPARQVRIHCSLADTTQKPMVY